MNTNQYISAILCVALIFGLNCPVAGQSVPGLVNYQGRLVNSNGVPLATADYELHFSLWNASTGGTRVWGSQHFDNVPGPGHGAKVPVVQGWFNVILGPVDTTGAPLTDAFNATNRYLEIRVGTNTPIMPRQQILSAPYAIKAERAVVADQALNLRGAATTEAMTFYVSTNGSDSNDGLLATRAKRTIQAAVDSVPDRIRHPVDIRVSPGTYAEMVTVEHKRSATTDHVILLTISGTGSTPDEVVITGQGTRPYAVFLNDSQVRMRNMTFEGSRGIGIEAAYYATLHAESCVARTSTDGFFADYFSSIHLHNCTVRDGTGSPSYGISAGVNSHVRFLGTNHVINCSYGLRALTGSTITGSSTVVYQNVDTFLFTADGGTVP